MYHKNGKKASKRGLKWEIFVRFSQKTVKKCEKGRFRVK